MFFLNLSAFEFFALFSAVSAFVVTLYLLSRARKKQVVPTLRFWIQAQQPVSNQQRRRIQQPLSLILQLLGIAFLLLALAQLRLGSPNTSSRDHVLLLDTSSWMAANAGGRGNLLDEAKAKARSFVRSLPATDRVMVVRTDAVASPATGMESNRATVEKAIYDSRPGAAALNLDSAFAFAEQARRLHARYPGEVVFIGASRVAEHGLPSTSPKGLRVIPVEAPKSNVGLTKIGLRRASSDPEVWDTLVSIRNYGTAAKRVPVVILYGGAPAGSRLVDVPSGKEAETTFQFRTRAAGWVEARLLTSDSLSEDNRALLEIPALQALKVVVYTNEPDLLRPALAAHPQIQATFRSPAEYAAKSDASVVVLDRFVPAELPQAATVWINPPASKSPFAVRTSANDVPIVRWRADHDLGSGLHTRQLRLPATSVFSMGPEDVAVAEVEAGPVIVARPKTKMIALGFHPGHDLTRYELATPLLLANTLRWVNPEVFRSSETYGQTVGAVSVVLNGAGSDSNVRVLGDGRELPFTIQDRTVRFFSGVPDRVRVITDTGEQVHSLSLPELGTSVWEPPAGTRRGVPGRFDTVLSRDIWQLLALLGAACLITEWLLYGKAAARKHTSASTTEPEPSVLRKAS
jgi:hypothetical protein